MENYIGIIAGAIVAVFLICYYLNRELVATQSKLFTIGNALNLLIPKAAPTAPVPAPVHGAVTVATDEVNDEATAENKED